MAAEFDSKLVYACDVQNDAEITSLFEQLGQQWDGLDALVHSIAFAPSEALEGDFLESASREAFRISQEISAYSFPALAKAARPLMKGRNGSRCSPCPTWAQYVPCPTTTSWVWPKPVLKLPCVTWPSASGPKARGSMPSLQARSRPWQPPA
jgi:NAD(P)-dependent dehydrogenase (short-subunit alcohol dehydrogenase family)